MSLEIIDLHVQIEDDEIKPILNGIKLKIQPGEIHALMGLNGSGKTTLAKALMGHPLYQVSKGKILLNGEDIVSWKPDRRARKGLFLSFQAPESLDGVSVRHFLQAAVETKNSGSNGGSGIDPLQFRSLVNQEVKNLEMDPSFLLRDLNVGFSGGERKRAEVLQFLMLKPGFAILDEIDTGLDVDALRIISREIKRAQEEYNTGILLITHYKRILQHIKPDYVHILGNGQILKSGGPELASRIEKDGYNWIEKGD